jgi:hypothetical protein
VTDLQTVLHLIDELSPQEREIIRQYLIESPIRIIPEIEPMQPRILGLHAHLGKAWTSDDFDAELPDSFWGFDEA